MNDTQDTTRHHQHTKVNANGDGGGDAQCVCDRCTSHTLNAAAVDPDVWVFVVVRR